MVFLLKMLDYIQRCFSLGTSALSHHDPTTYVLTLEQMLENEYPLPSTSSVTSTNIEFDDQWVELPPLEASGSIGKKDKKGKKRAEIFSIDCEMVSRVSSDHWKV